MATNITNIHFACQELLLVPRRAGHPTSQSLPTCLWSAHLDDRSPGDRAAECGAGMEPVAVCLRPDGEWALVHRCAGCDAVRLNRIAGDDNPLALMHIAVRPLARPPFPLEWLARL